MNRSQIQRAIRGDLPEGIRTAVVELLEHAVDDHAAGDLLIAGVSLLVEPFAFPKPAIQLAPMSGPMPHPLEVVKFVHRYGASSAQTKPHVPAQNAVGIWRSCPAAMTCRPEFRHAIRSLHVHLTMPDIRSRVLRQTCIAATACLLNPVKEPAA